ncbi:tetratricopeptide repeat protein [Acidocella sp.]|uniref:tetratricopeptide repeat protein n=1 Tax=Acidocella sp. TaxID=50710 RepID=UPI0026164764|nr:tetratricopeptide repeat protein [Acidocella sp.]
MGHNTARSPKRPFLSPPPAGKLAYAGFALVFALTACSSSQPDNAQAEMNDGSVLNVADAALAGHDPDLALKISQAVLNRKPHDLQALYHEGAAYYATGRCEDAIAAYQLALSYDPSSSEAETGLGRCLLKRNAIEAENAFSAAIADDPTNAAAYNDLGIARDLRGDYAGATAPYEQALKLAPGTLATEVNLGLSLALSGDAEDALEYLGPLAIGTQASPRIREDYAVALLAAGRTAEAREALAVDIPPEKLDQAMTSFQAVLAPAAPPAGTAALEPVPSQASAVLTSPARGQPPVCQPPPTLAEASFIAPLHQAVLFY